jgi:hypothetical protein
MRPIPAFACVAGSIFAAALAFGQNEGLNQPPLPNSLHGRHAWIIIGRHSPNSSEDPTEDLKAFNRALAVQATDEQLAAYDSMVRATEGAISDLQPFLEQQLQSTAPQLSGAVHSLDQAVENARNENRHFVESFSKTQQNGLREMTLRLTKADSDLAQQDRVLDQSLGATNLDVPQIASSGKNLDHALSAFLDQQYSLGKEMGIEDLSAGEELSFNLPPVKSSTVIGSQSIETTATGTLSRTAAEGGNNTFKLELTSDLSDLQQKITEILRSKLDKGSRCGERAAIQRASLTVEAPAVLVVTQLHFERWACFGSLGQESELAEGDGAIELKLTPAVQQNQRLQLVAEVSRIDAEGAVGEQLRSGPLGTAVREQTTESVLAAMQAGMNLKTILPAIAQEQTAIQRAEFRGAGALRLFLGGTVRMSDDQLKIMANQLKDRLSAQQTAQQ